LSMYVAQSWLTKYSRTTDPDHRCFNWKYVYFNSSSAELSRISGF